jgi:hypothetical protein
LSTLEDDDILEAGVAGGDAGTMGVVGVPSLYVGDPRARGDGGLATNVAPGTSA